MVAMQLQSVEAQMYLIKVGSSSAFDMLAISQVSSKTWTLAGQRLSEQDGKRKCEAGRHAWAATDERRARQVPYPPVPS